MFCKVAVIQVPTFGISDPTEAARTVRLILHRARKPAELSRFPLALALCVIFECPDPPTALRIAVEDALADREEMLREIILGCDIDGRMTLREACERFAVSRRHFQRYRARAVRAIADRIRELVLDRADGDVLDRLIA